MFSYTAYDDAQLVELLKAGDEAAFTALYERYALRLFADIYKLVKSEDQAQEILQEVFIKIWTVREQVNSELSFRSYLFKIAENRVYSFFRKVARDKKLMQDLQAAVIESYVEDELSAGNGSEREALLQKAIDSLPPQRKKVFILCKLEGKSYKEAGEALGLSVSTVKDHIVKGSKAIREQIFRHSDISLGVFYCICTSSFNPIFHVLSIRLKNF